MLVERGIVPRPLGRTIAQALAQVQWLEEKRARLDQAAAALNKAFQELRAR